MAIHKLVCSRIIALQHQSGLHGRRKRVVEDRAQILACQDQYCNGEKVYEIATEVTEVFVIHEGHGEDPIVDLSVTILPDRQALFLTIPSEDPDKVFVELTAADAVILLGDRHDVVQDVVARLALARLPDL